MSDEEEDYMSDKFLTGLSDVRPSLINNRAKKRQIMVESKQKDHIKKQRDMRAQCSAVVNNEKLQEALSKPLENDNKGFKLLAKMGYKPGQALGKANGNENSGEASTPSRLLEPIGITLKSDRQGLGRESALRELMEKQIQLRKQRLQKENGAETSIEEFRRRTNEKAEERFVTNALKRCQKTCENLDIQNHVDTPAMPWFWPELIKEKDEANDEEENHSSDSEDEVSDEFSNAEKLEMLINYIRTSYNFCFWCGIRYEDLDDLSTNCPGLNKDDH
ncbi:G patch domain-containing protein 11 [Musca vetustissima]|uniref:G patch domain-containing protein 11 n=1 Tax=Musca vetustissima TaxID=27455 RepID=UPI002AB7E4D5|nr:G patch domain-containing protein 11 [Musca vetustissima]